MCFSPVLSSLESVLSILLVARSVLDACLPGKSQQHCRGCHRCCCRRLAMIILLNCRGHGLIPMPVELLLLELLLAPLLQLQLLMEGVRRDPCGWFGCATATTAATSPCPCPCPYPTNQRAQYVGASSSGCGGGGSRCRGGCGGGGGGGGIRRTYAFRHGERGCAAARLPYRASRVGSLVQHLLLGHLQGSSSAYDNTHTWGRARAHETKRQ